MAGNGLPDMGGGPSRVWVASNMGVPPSPPPPLSKVNERLKPWALGTGWGGSVGRGRAGSAPCHLSVMVPPRVIYL